MIRVRGYDFDTAYAAYFQEPYERKFGLDSLAQRWTPEFSGYKDIIAPYVKDGDYSKIPRDVMLLYNAADCDIPKRVEEQTRDSVPAALIQMYIECAFTLRKMEIPGIAFDYTFYNEIAERLPKKIEDIESKCRAIAGYRGFNPRAPVEVAKVLFRRLRLPQLDGTSTKEEVLEQLKTRHEFPGLILQHRRLSKQESTYVKKYKEIADHWGGWVRTIYWLTGAITGRLRSGGKEEKFVTNLQNIAKDPLIQNLLVSDLHWREALDAKSLRTLHNLLVFLIVDYSQMELRILAEIANVRWMLDVFRDGKKDIHCELGHRAGGIPREEILEDEDTRTKVKGLNFGVVYGLGVEGAYDHLRINLGVKNVTKDEIRDFYKGLDKQCPEIQIYTRRMRAFVEKHGYCETMFGFRRPVDTGDREEEGYGDERKTYWGNQAINCMDFETEVLTRRGWVSGHHLTYVDELLTKNQNTEALEWQAPQRINIFPGRHRVVRFESRSFSACTNEPHRWLVYDKRRKESRCVTTADLVKSHGDLRIHRTGTYGPSSRLPLSDSEISLLGIVLTDGYYPKRKLTQRVNASFTVGITQTKTKTRAWIERMLKRAGVPYNCSQNNYRFGGNLSKSIRALCPDKRLSLDLLARISRRQALLLVAAMMRGDGTAYSGTDKRCFCAGIHKQDADLFQYLAVLAGIATSVHIVSVESQSQAALTPIYVVTLLRRKHAQVVPKQCKNDRVDSGLWCPTVPNGFIVVRRKGQVYITGNTPIQGTAHQALLCALAALHLAPERFKALSDPCLEVHDAAAFRVRLADLPVALEQARDLMERTVLRYIKKRFGFSLRVPLKVDAKAGFRFGDMVKGYSGGDGVEFIRAWRKVHKKNEAKVEEKFAA